MENSKPMIDGRPELFAWIDSINPREELSPADLQKSLPAGFALTGDVDKPVLHGPLGTSTTVPTLERWGGGLKIKGLVLLEAVARLLERGPRVWERSLERQADYWRQEIKTADAIMVEPKDPLGTRDAMENHVADCNRCQPAFAVLQQAVDWGSSRTRDQDLKELIARSHENSAAAKTYYESVRDATFGAMAAASAKGSSRKKEVPA
jgi:hypothetical protein